MTMTPKSSILPKSNSKSEVNILLLETIEESAQQLLAERFNITVLTDPKQWSELSSPENFDAVLTRGKGLITKGLLDFFPNLKCVARCGVGLDNFDLEACDQKKIAVLNLPGATTIAAAEQTFYFILSLVRNLHSSINSTKQGKWDSRNDYRGDDLYGKKLGLIGFGDIAQRVAGMADAFGMEILYWNHRDKPSHFQQVSFEELLSTCDIISIHCALTEDTEHIIDEVALQQMKKGTYLINTARGKHINQDAVLAALKSNQLAGFAADVFTPEPPSSDDELLTHPRAIITPHISALTASTYRRMSHDIVEKLCQFLARYQSH